MFSLALWIFDRHPTNSSVFPAKTHSSFDLSDIAQSPTREIFFVRPRKPRNFSAGAGRCVKLFAAVDQCESVAAVSWIEKEWDRKCEGVVAQLTERNKSSRPKHARIPKNCDNPLQPFLSNHHAARSLPSDNSCPFLCGAHRVDRTFATRILFDLAVKMLTKLTRPLLSAT